MAAGVSQRGHIHGSMASLVAMKGPLCETHPLVIVQ